MQNSKTYLVTGVAGFIASKTAEILIEEGHRVIGIDNLNDYYDIRLKLYRLERLRKSNHQLPSTSTSSNIDIDQHYPWASSESISRKKSESDPSESFQFHRIDIEDLETLQTLFETFSFDAVLNLAARAGVRYSIENPHIYLSTNGAATLNLLECMRHNCVKKMVLASTSSLYAGQEMPFNETLAVNSPISPYAASKKAAEAMAFTYHNLFDIDVSVVRYFTVFGPAGRPDMSPFRFIKWINEGTPITLFGDGKQSRDFTYVDDIARGTIAALKKIGYEIINLGGGKNPISLLEMIEEIENNLGKQAIINQMPKHKTDMHSTWADIEKAENLLSWKPHTNWKEGFRKTINWHLENPDLVRLIEV